MKNILKGLTAALLVTGIAFAQQAQKQGQPTADGKRLTFPQTGNRMKQDGRGMMRPMMKQRGMMEQGMRPGMMEYRQMGPMHTQPQTSMVSSDNGGVIILSGNRLMKFDKNLNLVKEVELFQKDRNKKVTPKVQAPSGKK